MAIKYYGSIPAKDLNLPNRVEEPPQLAARRLTMESKQVGQAGWSRRYSAPSYRYGETKHAFALQVLNEIIGGGTTSRLYQSLVVDQSLAVAAGSWYRAESIGPSVFGFYASPQEGVSMERLERGIDREIRLVLRDGVTKDEVRAAITRLQRTAIFAKDSVTAPARIIGSALASGRSVHDIENWPDKISKVSKDDVVVAAEWVFRITRSLTATLLPTSVTQRKP